MKIRPAAALLLSLAAFASPEPARVAVLANAADPASLELASHYLRSRGIPEKNLIALTLPESESISWDDFVFRLRNPLLTELESRGFLEGRRDAASDAEKRIRFWTTKNAVDFLVVCKGVPLKIDEDTERLRAREATLALPPQFRVNRASVDSELAVLPRPETPLAGYVPSPWYNIESPSPTLAGDTLRVARLDGPTYASARKLVDNALRAESEGLLGRAYIDKGGPHAKGDEWLSMTEELCRRAGFDTSTDTPKTLIPEGARFDAPALYFGWYAEHIAGAPAASDFTFPPGAIAIHIHSFSAKTLRDAKSGWTGPLVAHGVTATVGNTEEPYLELTHNPALFLSALLTGKTAGEAAAYAAPALSWQTVFIGDPLYRPFKHDLREQLADIDRAPNRRLAYAVLNAVRRLDAGNESAKADELLARAFSKLPVLPLAREILERETKARVAPSFRAERLAAVKEDAGLVLETAEKLASSSASGEALALLKIQSGLGVSLPAKAADLARRCGDPALASRLTAALTAQSKSSR